LIEQIKSMISFVQSKLIDNKNSKEKKIIYVIHLYKANYDWTKKLV
jgi:hypothetical protein